jgi:transcriptional regulator with XRE-family HTH domain
VHQSPNRIEELREARLRAGLTQQRLAELSGLQRQHVSAIENHRLLLTDERARKIAPHLGTHPAALVVGHAAAQYRGGANRPSVTAEDFRSLVRAFSAARARDVASPRLRLELVRVVREVSDALFAVWHRLLDDAEREAQIDLEVRTT